MTISGNNQRKRWDALLALSLRRFQAMLASLSDEELVSLEARAADLMIGARFARSSHGLERHLAVQRLPLLQRRRLRTQEELARRAKPALRLLEPVATALETGELVVVKRAA